MSFEGPLIATATGDVTGSLPGTLSLNPAADYAKSSTYVTYYTVANRFDALAANTWILGEWQAAPRISTGATAAGGTFYLTSADYAIGSKTLYARLTMLALVNATAPTNDFTLGLYPVATPAGASGIVTVTLGAVVAGSTAVVSAPGAGGVVYAAATDFAFPAAGAYTLAVLTSGAMAANSSVVIRARIQTRAV